MTILRWAAFGGFDSSASPFARSSLLLCLFAAFSWSCGNFAVGRLTILVLTMFELRSRREMRDGANCDGRLDFKVCLRDVALVELRVFISIVLDKGCFA